jgi:transcriptional regulator with XRE-family HTH domain
VARYRIDVEGLHDALDEARKAQGLSWRQLAKEVDVSPSLLSRLGNGYRPDADGFATLVRWLRMPAETFMLGDQENVDRRQPELVTELAPLLRARKDLNATEIVYLEEIIQASVKLLNSRREARGEEVGD